jgi:predicted nucleic acid-binding protein
MAGPNPQAGLIDSNIIIDLTRQLPAAQAFIQPLLALGAPETSVVCTMEVIQGCRNQAELNLILSFLSLFRIYPISSAASLNAQAHLTALTLSHGLGIPDALIAATALELRLPLYTLNTKHFAMVPGLQVL